MLFDTHCHLDAPEHHLAPDALLAAADAAGVSRVLLVAVEPGHWSRCASIAAAHPQQVRLALGIHPQVIRDLSDDALQDALDALPHLLRAHGACAVGEIGLDFLQDRDPTLRARQERALLAQLDIAAALDLPVSLHCLKAHDALLRLWRRHPLKQRAPGLLHAFSGSADLVPVYAAENLAFGFGGATTWTNARRAPEACRAVPAHLLVLETDAPYMPPHPLPDGPSRPDLLPRIAAHIAALRGLSPEALAALTTANARRLLESA